MNRNDKLTNLIIIIKEKWDKAAATHPRTTPMTCAGPARPRRKERASLSRTLSSSNPEVTTPRPNYRNHFLPVAEPDFVVTRRDSLGMAAKEHTQGIVVAS